MITILRIVFATEFDIEDFTYSMGKIIIVTALEPLLGTIIACLPIFPPTLKRAFRRTNGSQPPTVISSSVARLRSKSLNRSVFRRFYDSYSLTDLEDGRTETRITSAGSRSSSTLGVPVAKLEPELDLQSSIKVKQGWDVRSESKA